MLKREVENGNGGRVIVMDSITKLTPDDAGAIVVSASHGGVSSGEFALAVPLMAVFFNDAGVGKDNAGIAALEMHPVIPNRRKGIGREPAFRLGRYVVEFPLELGNNVVWALREVQLGICVVALGGPAGRIIHQIGKRDVASAGREIEVPGA